MVQVTRGRNVAQMVFDDDTGQSIGAGETYKTDVIRISGLEKIKVLVELSYHAAATKGGRVDIIPMVPPDETGECTDSYVTATTPSFAAGQTKSKVGSPVDIYGLRKIKLAVVNLDAAQALMLKKLYIY